MVRQDAAAGVLTTLSGGEADAGEGQNEELHGRLEALGLETASVEKDES